MAKQQIVTVWLVSDDYRGAVSLAHARARKTAKRYIMDDDRADGFGCRAHFEHQEVYETPDDARAAWRCKCAARVKVAREELAHELEMAAKPIGEAS